MHFIYFVLLGFLPSVVWLLFYLKKDVHPESNWMIIKIFLYGILGAFLAGTVELIIELGLFSKFDHTNIFISIIDWFIVIAFTEEITKYLVVKLRVLKSPELDEPFDVVLYMIIAALGFAALENVFVFLSSYPDFPKTLIVAGARFLSATLLHALASGVLGYFLALSFLNLKRRKTLLFTGITSAVILHGLYNFSIMIIKNPLQILIPLTILIAGGAFVSSKIKKLKKIKSVCIIK